MTFLIAASELDLNDPESREKLKPLHRVLDKGWMIPCHAPLCRLSAFFGACLLAFLLICLFVCLFFLFVFLFTFRASSSSQDVLQHGCQQPQLPQPDAVVQRL